jgi:hypothetical protein
MMQKILPLKALSTSAISDPVNLSPISPKRLPDFRLCRERAGLPDRGN